MSKTTKNCPARTEPNPWGDFTDFPDDDGIGDGRPVALVMVEATGEQRWVYVEHLTHLH